MGFFLSRQVHVTSPTEGKVRALRTRLPPLFCPTVRRQKQDPPSKRAPHGEFLFHIFGALAQFERSLIQERIQAGLAAAARRARRGGRPVTIDTEKLGAVTAALDSGATKAAVCRTFGIKRSTLIDSLARIGWSAGPKRQEA